MYKKEDLKNIEIKVLKIEETIKELQKEKRKLKRILDNQKYYDKNYNRADFKNTFAFKKFGKRQKDLNETELKEFKKEQMREWRKKNKK